MLHGPIERRERLQVRLVYGCYPELLQLSSYREKESCLSELVQSYLLKDILSLEGIRYSRTVLKLLQLIARQVGAEVSMQELGRQLDISKNTVERYLDLLTKVFVLYRMGGDSAGICERRSPRAANGIFPITGYGMCWPPISNPSSNGKI